MKKNTKLFGFIAFVAIIAVIFSTCDNGNSTDEPQTPVVTVNVDNTNPTLASGLTINLTGNATVSGDTIFSYEWSTKSVPSVVTLSTLSFGDKNSANTTLTGIKKAGEYVFELKATSNGGKTGIKVVTVNVAPITKTIIVPEHLTPGYSFNFTQIYTVQNGWDSNFGSVYFTYLLKFGSENFPSGTSSISASGRVNGFYELSQTFYYNDIIIDNGNRSVLVEVDGNAFTDLYNNYVDNFPIGPFGTQGKLPELTLVLIKDSID